jgi:hypothetical protein
MHAAVFYGRQDLRAGRDVRALGAGTYPTEGWVETIAFDKLISDGFERLHRQEGTKILVNVANVTSES